MHAHPGATTPAALDPCPAHKLSGIIQYFEVVANLLLSTALTGLLQYQHFANQNVNFWRAGRAVVALNLGHGLLQETALLQGCCANRPTLTTQVTHGPIAN